MHAINNYFVKALLTCAVGSRAPIRLDHAYVAADVPADPCLPLRVSRSVTRLARDEPSGIDEGDEGVKAGGVVGETENRKQKTQGGG